MTADADAATAPAGRAFLALGSNLGDRRGNLTLGVSLIPDVVAVSPVYETAPVGGPDGQGPFLNCVVEVRTALSPMQLLDVAQAAEAAAHRVRLERWGPRTLDVDVLLVGEDGERVVDTPTLTVPHPRMWQRGFVLVPLADLDRRLVGDRLTPELALGVVAAGSV
ncbi:2-amino-4-hydroxy-6-hydroxymethyldihydropteridine diphosphokinase [Acidiferrimicrobium sp. IK]|uniref:2-amino-4-hydroxy-6- hydroxymethyldihydropteridine diphosphokinase n=1 Tax=Acidiferrimicrobium sp. IK TaxID=2871700 RepID=UPI0021CAEB9C|nr:2-amino-4-hydroxy-6-hydroxymethyldihydropteridine diphosphokinase [Acidiferrimicrobium sp. IK]MCU4186980.1 2-amino-4-hydroxy-6-hydroxymethyldihydropteridine diphosphokinase [Acidiferrimicrobium sp. IK]